MAMETMGDLHARVAGLRADAFVLIDDLQGALRGAGSVLDDDVAAALVSLQAVANRLGRVEAALATRLAPLDGPLADARSRPAA